MTSQLNKTALSSSGLKYIKKTVNLLVWLQGTMDAQPDKCTTVSLFDFLSAAQEPRHINKYKHPIKALPLDAVPASPPVA